MVDDPAGHITLMAGPLATNADRFYWNATSAPATGRRIPAWQLSAGVAPQPVTPRDGMYKWPVDAVTETLTFLPYGCTKLRIVTLPAFPNQLLKWVYSSNQVL